MQKPREKPKPARKVGIYDRPASADKPQLARKLLLLIILLLVAALIWYLLLR